MISDWANSYCIFRGVKLEILDVLDQTALQRQRRDAGDSWRHWHYGMGNLGCILCQYLLHISKQIMTFLPAEHYGMGKTGCIISVSSKIEPLLWDEIFQPMRCIME